MRNEALKEALKARRSSLSGDNNNDNIEARLEELNSQVARLTTENELLRRNTAPRISHNVVDSIVRHQVANHGTYNITRLLGRAFNTVRRMGHLPNITQTIYQTFFARTAHGSAPQLAIMAPPPPPLPPQTEVTSHLSAKDQIKKNKQDKLNANKNFLAKKMYEKITFGEDRHNLEARLEHSTLFIAHLKNKKLIVEVGGETYDEQSLHTTICKLFIPNTEYNLSNIDNEICQATLDKLVKLKMINSDDALSIDSAIAAIRTFKKSIFEDSHDKPVPNTGTNATLNNISILKGELQDFTSLQENTRAQPEMGSFTKANINDAISFIDNLKKDYATIKTSLQDKLKFDDARIAKIATSNIEQFKKDISKHKTLEYKPREPVISITSQPNQSSTSTGWLEKVMRKQAKALEPSL